MRTTGTGTKVNAVAVAAALVLGAATALVATPAQPAAADPPGCHNGVNGQTCEAGSGHPGHVVDLTSEVAPHVSSGVKKCLSGRPGRWMDVGPPFNAALDLDPGPPPTPGARYWLFVCPNHIDGQFNPVNWEGGGWGGVNPPEEPPTAADVLPALWQDVRARLHAPQLDLSPAPGRHAILSIPTFVGIANPQIATSYTATAANSAGTVTVGIDVVPTTRLHPGERGSTAVPCDDDGHAYARGAGTPRAQAAADPSCTYAYTHRSAHGWHGNVTITWAVEWWSNTGEGGGLVAAPSVQGFTRVADEIQTVIVHFGDH
jgi:hypothetical protein